MEKVAIFLRQAAAINHFRTVILRSFDRKEFDQLLLCSGFFQERGTFSASRDLAGSSPKWLCRKKVTAVGVYNGIWKPDFDRFIAGLQTIQCCCGIPLSVEKRRTRRYHWHAKIFIASEGDDPALGIVGSSNMTRNAFGTSGSWNYEADVVLWNSDSAAANHVMDNVLEGISNIYQQSVIVTSYNAEEPPNRNLSLQDRLRFLRDEINEQSGIVE
ncbi:hypothetical protein [Metallibacterium scheffleri]|uniref:hypothetical protein n=1 Tax=Metallibacterium scheffleri TaxID=993689 RepID=UPI0023F17C9B|nr:hypothetical protein [Metallibacterium scheffleri]